MSTLREGGVGRLNEATKIGGGSIPYVGSEGLVKISNVGNVALNGATPVTVNDPTILKNSIVVFSLSVVGGTQGTLPRVVAYTSGTSFDVVGDALDTSVYNYRIL
jgi:hypothetical protein